MSVIEDKLVKLSAQLYPTGKAFRMHPGGNRERLYKAFARTEREFWDGCLNVLHVILPDNDKFTTEDATDWERRLGMFSNPALTLAVRKAAITQRMSAPGSQPARSHILWIEKELQAAGFPVYVFENIPATNPATINPAILSESQHGNTRYHGMQSHYINHIVVNSVDNDTDINFDIGPSLRSTFFIGGTPLGTYANVPAAREKEFRQLILQLKQAQNQAILFVNLI